MTNSHTISDSGCTGHLLGPNTPCDHKQPTAHGLTVSLPNGQTIRSTHMSLMTFPKMPHSARQAHVLPALKHKALLSIGKLCDLGFKAIFDNTNVQLANTNNTITGTRDLSKGLYFIDLQKPAGPVPCPLNSHVSNAHKMATKADLVQYLHRAAFSLVVSTSTQAIDSGFLSTWPGLTSDLVHKHILK